MDFPSNIFQILFPEKGDDGHHESINMAERTEMFRETRK